MNDFIENSKIIYDYFGYFPNFHDDEILSVYLDRSVSEIECVIKSSKNQSDINKTCKIKLKFINILEMELKDFNSQNVIYDISFEQLDESIKTIIKSSYGLEGSIVSSKVTIISIEPLND